MDLNRGVILQLRFGTLLRISFYIGFYEKSSLSIITSSSLFIYFSWHVCKVANQLRTLTTLNKGYCIILLLQNLEKFRSFSYFPYYIVYLSQPPQNQQNCILAKILRKEHLSTIFPCTYHYTENISDASFSIIL